MKVVFEERESRGIVKDFYTNRQETSQDYKEAPYFYKSLMEMTEADPVLSTATDLTVDLATYNGYTFIGENQRGIKAAIKLFNDTLDFDQVIDNVLYQLLVYGDSYLEVRWNESKTKVMELHPLETTEMRIDYDEHGEISRYWQVVAGSAKENWVSFEKDEVIYFRLKWIGSQVYSKHPYKAVASDMTTNLYANHYLQSVFRNLPPKIIYFLKTASKEQRKQFIENLIRAKTNPQLDIIMQGEADSKLMQMNFDEGLLGVLEWLQKRVLMVTRVPPHWVGMLQGANRGIGENVVIPYETKIKKLQQKIASQINKELMPKLNLGNIQFKWNAISLMDEKTIVEVMNYLKAQGFDSDTIIEYAREHGIKLREGAEIEKPELPTGSAQVMQNKTAISRTAKDGSMTSNINKKGVSEEGKEKLEVKQGAGA